jgi:hypothetical protein
LEQTEMDSAYLTEATAEDIIQEVSKTAVPETAYSKKIRPRAIVFKSSEKDLKKIKDFIETETEGVEIIYVTTGPAASKLHVTKSMPLETSNSAE